MLDTKQKVIHGIAQLSSLAAGLSKASAGQVLQLRDELLALPDDDQWLPGGRSGLNANGSPLQYCISTSSKGWRGRFIADPACIIGPPGQRYRYSYQALQNLYRSRESLAIRPWCEDMLNFHLPTEKEALTDYPDGVLWLGASPDDVGMAVYMDGRRGGHTVSWKRLQAWLNTLMPHNTVVDDFIHNVSRYAGIMSIGLEGSSIENLRAKIYFRLSQQVSLHDLGIPLLLREEFTSFLKAVVGNRQIKLSGLVFTIGFHIASARMYDAKIDVCGCPSCVSLDPKAWIQLMQRTTSLRGLSPFPVTAGVLAEQCALSYYGVGVDHKGAVRMNLYLKNRMN